MKVSDWKNILRKKNLLEYDEDYVPYWGFYDLYHKAGVKLGNCFYIIADIKKENGEYFYKYSDMMQLSGFSLEKFIDSIRNGNIFVDFDARTRHNHGTKFRILQSAIPSLYENVSYI